MRELSVNLVLKYDENLEQIDLTLLEETREKLLNAYKKPYARIEILDKEVDDSLEEEIS